MRKRTKAIYAGVAGFALLTTTGGTLALWRDNADLANDMVRTGDLRLDFASSIEDRAEPVLWTHYKRVRQADGTLASGPPQYVLAKEDATLEDIGSIAPGDRLVGKTYVAATLAGSTLVAGFETLTHSFPWADDEENGNGGDGNGPELTQAVREWLDKATINASVGRDDDGQRIQYRPVDGNVLAQIPVDIEVLFYTEPPIDRGPASVISTLELGTLRIELRQVIGGAAWQHTAGSNQ